MMRQALLPTWKTSPAVLSTTKSSFTEPMDWFSGCSMIW
jgi:hypothetical protein